MKIDSHRFAFALALALIASCAEPRKAERVSIDTDSSRVDVFLRSSGDTIDELRLELGDIQLRDASNELIPLARTRATITSSAATKRISIAGSTVPPRSYRSIVLTIQSASQDRGGRRIPLKLLPQVAAADRDAPQVPSVEPEKPADAERGVDYEIPLRLEVRRREAASIFLEWNAAGSVDSALGLRPEIIATLEAPQSRLGTMYVVDSATDSVLVLARASSQVIGTVKVGARPRAIAVSNDRRKLFVANAGDGSGAIIDTQQSFSRFNVPIRLSAETSDVVEADAGRIAAFTNPGLDSVSLIDVQTATNLENLRVGRAPTRLVDVERLRRLFVIDSLSNQVSVIDLASRSVIATIPVESGPSAIAADRDGREVWIGHKLSRNLLVLDADTLATKATVFVGDNVSALLVDRNGQRVFVARGGPNELVVVDRGLGSIVRRTALSGRIENFAQPVEGSLIYGAAPTLGGLIVVDPLLGREQPLIPCGTEPTDVVAVE